MSSSITTNTSSCTRFIQTIIWCYVLILQEQSSVPTLKDYTTNAIMPLQLLYNYHIPNHAHCISVLHEINSHLHAPSKFRIIILVIRPPSTNYNPYQKEIRLQLTLDHILSHSCLETSSSLWGSSSLTAVNSLWAESEPFSNITLVISWYTERVQ